MLSLNLIPLVRLLLPLAVGIIFGFHYSNSSLYNASVTVFFFVLLAIIYFTQSFIIKYSRQWIFGILIHLFLFAAGYSLTTKSLCTLTNEELEIISASKQKNTLALATIIDCPEQRKNSVKVIAAVSDIYINGKWTSFNKKALLYIADSNVNDTVKFGDKLLLKTKLTIIPGATNPGEFDYKKYLFFHGIPIQAYVAKDKYVVVDANCGNKLYLWANTWRDKLVSILKASGLSEQDLAVASALIIGERTQLDATLMQAYSASGAMHILSVSGLHVGIVFLVINNLLLFLNRFKWGIIVKTVLLIAFLWFYALLTGLSPSVLRAATMFSFIVLGQALNRKANIYNTLAASAIVLLLINPALIMDVGFQLSYLAVLGIVFLYPKFYELWLPNNSLLDKMWSLLCVSLAAQLATLPLTFYYFHQFPTYFLITNLIVIPLSSGIIYLGIITLMLTWVPTLFQWFGLMLNKSVQWLNLSVIKIESLPGSIIDQVYINEIQLVLLFLLLLFIILYFVHIKVNYLFFSFLTVFIFIIVVAHKNYEKAIAQKFIVFSIHKSSAYMFKCGTKGIFIADSSFMANKSSQKFHTESYRKQLGIDDEVLITIDNEREGNNANVKKVYTDNFYCRSNFIQANKKRILLINNRNAGMLKKLISDNMILDYIILSGNVNIKLKALMSYFRVGRIIIDSSNSIRKSNLWMNEAKELNLRCFSVKTQGALEFEL